MTSPTAPAFAVVGPNPAVDRIVSISGFAVGRVHRTEDLAVVPGGKGLNVARFLAELGARPLTMGWAGGPSGDWVAAAAAAEGCVPAFTPLAGETRVCHVVSDPTTGIQTVINEAGPPVDASDEERLLADVARRAAETGWVLICGSCPPGVSDDFFARLVQTARAAGARVGIDASGPLLAEALPAGPDFVKVNSLELAEALGAPAGDSEPLLRKLAARPELAGSHIFVTLGQSGSLVVSGGALFRVRPLPAAVVNATGAGDAYMAGVALELACSGDARAAARLGAACAAAKLGQFAPRLGMDLPAIRSLIPQVDIAIT